MSLINLFPILEESIVENSFGFSPVNWSYIRNQQECQLIVDSNGVIRDLDPQHAYWNPEQYDINYSFRLILKDKASLFADGENAVACHDATIGVATSWFSKASFQRGTIEHGVIRKDMSSEEIVISGSIPKASFRDTVTIDIILYLKESGNPCEDETYFANKPGCILGTIWSHTLLLDGIGSAFPTAYVRAGSSSPLWTITCDWDDPMSDDLIDTVCLNINRDNKLFKYLNNEKDNEFFDFSLLMEVMSSALSVIMEKLRSDDYDLEDIDRYAPAEGSVGMFVKYMYDAHNCNFANPQATSESIHKMIEKTLKK